MYRQRAFEHYRHRSASEPEAEIGSGVQWRASQGFAPAPLGAPGSGSAASRASVRIWTLARPAKRRSVILVDTVSRSPRPEEMAGVHKNTKIAMPEFQVSYEIARYLSRSRYGTAGAEFSRAMPAYSPPVHRNGQQQSASLLWSQTTEIVGGRFQGGTPENATS
jgi:hypothetical protein